MRKLIFLLIAIFSISTLAQAPTPINKALADLSERVGRELTLNDLNWRWSQESFGDTSLGCPQEGQMYAQMVVVGYQFIFTLEGQVYDYRVSGDETIMVLCSVMAEGEADMPDTPDTSDDYINPLCPTPPEGISYMRTRLVPQIQGRVSPGLPNTLRGEPSTQATLIGEIPGGGIFNVLAGPRCDEEGYIWWQVDFDGLIGWTAEGRAGDYFIEPLPGAPVVERRLVIDVESVVRLIEVSRLQGNITEHIAFSSLDENVNTPYLVATGGVGAEGAWVFDMTALDIAPRFLESTHLLTDVNFGENPQVALFGDASGAVRLWNLKPDATLVEGTFLLGHNNPISDAAYSPDGSFTASVGGYAITAERQESDNHAIVVWDMNTVSQRFGLRGHTGTVTGLEFTTASDQLYSASMDGTVRVWDMATGQGRILIQAENGITSMAYHAETGQIAYSTENGQVVVIDDGTGQTIVNFNAHAGVINDLVFTPNGQVLATSGDDGAFRAWNAADGTMLYETFNSAAVYDITVSGDGTLIAFVSGDNTIRIMVADFVSVG